MDELDFTWAEIVAIEIAIENEIENRKKLVDSYRNALALGLASDPDTMEKWIKNHEKRIITLESAFKKFSTIGVFD